MTISIKRMLEAKYPIIGQKEYVEIFVGKPEIDKHLPHTDYFCHCRIETPNFQKEFDVYGIDPMQATWLALRQIREELLELEKNNNIKCEYRYFQDFEK